MKNMIKSWILSLLLAGFYSLSAQNEHNISIETKIDSGTVYLSGVELTFNKEIKLKKGTNRIIFAGLASSLQPQSVRVSIKGNVQILSVTTETNYLSEEKLNPRITHLKDSVNAVKGTIGYLNDQVDAYNTEKVMLSKNQTISNAHSLAELQKVADFHRERTLQINHAIAELNKKVGEQKWLLEVLESQLEELNYRNNPERKEVIVVLSSTVDQTVNSQLKYLSTEGGWSPKYDLIAKDINSSVELKYNADIYNNTGLNWYNIRLKLSTADPSLSASRPALNPWVIDYRTEAKEGLYEKKSIGMYSYKLGLADTTGQKEKIEVDELSSEFIIDRPYDILSDGKPYLIHISRNTLPATFQYLAIPKIDKDAFLLAKVTGWEKLNLINGPASVYFGDNYIGESEINTRFVEDSLELSFGRDNQLLVTRAKREDIAGKKLIGSNRSEALVYEIVVKNNRNTPVSIEVQDQIPVPLESDITVELNESSGAMVDTQNGKLKWIATLNPGESMKYTLSFTVKYPKNKRVDLRVPRLTPKFL